MPDDTPTSTAPRSPTRRNKVWIAIQIAATAIVLWFVGRELADQWRRFRGVPIEVDFHWGAIAVSCVIVLAAYAVLIETWRRIIVAWGSSLGFGDAARIWFVSNLVRYLPYNFVFQLGAVAELSRRQQISPVAAAGASVINVIVNIAAGFVIALIAGFRALDKLSGGYALLGLVIASLMLVGLLALPAFLPTLLQLVKRVTGRELVLGALPRSAIYVSLVGNVVAWVLYGVAYQALVVGVIGSARGTMLDYIAVYAAAYVLGYLAFALPAGAGVREGAQTSALPMLGLATFGQAAVVAIAARVWLTALELIPALLFLALGAGRNSSVSTSRHGSNS